MRIMKFLRLHHSLRMRVCGFICLQMEAVNAATINYKKKFRTKFKFTGKRRNNRKKLLKVQFSTDNNNKSEEAGIQFRSSTRCLPYDRISTNVNKGQTQSTKPKKAVRQDFLNKSKENEEIIDVSGIFPLFSADNIDILEAGRHSDAEVDAFISASKRKLSEFSPADEIDSFEQNLVICELSALNEMVNGLLCPTCELPNISVIQNKQKLGLAVYLEVYCSHCKKNNKKVYSSKRSSGNIPKSTKFSATTSTLELTGGNFNNNAIETVIKNKKNPFTINMKVVIASKAVGLGYRGLARFAAIVGLPRPMHRSNYHDLSDRLHSVALFTVQNHLSEVKDKITSFYENYFKKDLNYKQGQISCMFDGTWQKRGHKSHNGVGVLIELHTGYIIDYYVVSNHCDMCEKGPKENSEDFQGWWKKHKANCQKNSDCSSNMMETEAAINIWSRSEAKYGFQYVEFLSDGDSKAYNAVRDLQVYGPEVNIVKEECVNHVGKRLGTALRNVNPQIPRGHKLSQEAIRKLTLYYQLAIKNNENDLKKMYTAIWASFIHCGSSDDHSNHRLCPQGESSWCRFNRAVYKNEPLPQHKPYITEEAGKVLKPIYERLSSPDLLAKCLKIKTQNPAESFNSRLWLLCPKNRWASHKTVETAAAIAVMQFNKGDSAMEDIFKNSSIPISEAIQKYSKFADRERIQAMQKKGTAKARHERLKRKVDLARREDEREDVEGPSYSAGGLDLGAFD